MSLKSFYSKPLGELDSFSYQSDSLATLLVLLPTQAERLAPDLQVTARQKKILACEFVNEDMLSVNDRHVLWFDIFLQSRKNLCLLTVLSLH